MAAQPLFFVGNLNPSIAESITNSDGTPHDLTGQTVTFKMRALRSATLTVSAAATVVSAPAGTVRYDWQVADVANAGQYLVWWTVTTTAGGKTQDMAEAVIEFRAHTITGTQPAYLELEDFKDGLGLSTDKNDALAIESINAASRGIDQATGRRFYLDADANQVRYYSPNYIKRLPIDDMAVLTSVLIDRGGTGSYTETWTQGQQFVLEPLNAVAKYRPFEHLVVRKMQASYLPVLVEKSVQVTGQFGWAVFPDDIKRATRILAMKLFTRKDAPFGIVDVGIDQGAAMRIAKTDPDVYTLIQPYNRHEPFI